MDKDNETSRYNWGQNYRENYSTSVSRGEILYIGLTSVNQWGGRLFQSQMILLK